jgi:asparagine synthase (glutamine-hydrolysing)
MISMLHHRGPDDEGAYLDDYAGLGHRRLSIIDLGGGAQPIHNENNSLWIVFNGEIFNYPELREELIEKGHKFYTATDTEVIVHLYEEHGDACVQKLNGQFAFAIWDSVKRKVMLARDRVGILPLHYSLLNNRLVFASEIKSIFALPCIRREADPFALDQIFTFWTTLPGRTAFKGINELPAGSVLTMGSGEIRIAKYWDFPIVANEEQIQLKPEEYVENIRDLLLDSIKIRLRADVPVGAYLSGGLDSSGITSLIKNNFNNRLKTFGINFENEKFDESSYQNEMINYLNTDHSHILVTNKEIGNIFPDIIWNCEKPLLRTAPVPLFLLSRKVRECGLKVVLSGEGADEIFCGYNIFRETKARRFWGQRPDSVLRPMLLGKLYPYILSNKKLQPTLASFFRQGIESPDDFLFSHMIRWANTARIKTFFSSDFCAETKGYNCMEVLKNSLPKNFADMDFLARAQYLESALFMCNYLLSSQGDRMAMGNSVEMRVPYLDHRIIEYAAKIPSKWKLRGLQEKYILKKAFYGQLPKKILFRNKQPYRAPVKESIFDSSEEQVLEMLSAESLHKYNIFNPNKVSLLLQKFKAKKNVGEFDAMALAGIYSTQVLINKFIDKPDTVTWNALKTEHCLNLNESLHSN